MEFLLRYNGHVTFEGQANGLPEKVYVYHLIDSDSIPGIVKQIDQDFRNFIGSQGMFTSPDPTKIQEYNKLDTTRMFVPIHVLSRITMDIYPVTEYREPDDPNQILPEVKETKLQ